MIWDLDETFWRGTLTKSDLAHYDRVVYERFAEMALAVAAAFSGRATSSETEMG